MNQSTNTAALSINKHLFVGFLVIIILIGGLGGWAAFTSISGAIIAEGIVVVESNIKKVQHREGGIVGAIYVKDGDRVLAGDLLVQLDDTLMRANLAIITKQLDELMTRQARFEAERNNEKEIKFPTQLIARKAELHLEKAFSGEIVLFETRHTILKSQKDQNIIRIDQLREEILGLAAQVQSKQKELSLIGQELKGLEVLLKKGHVPVTRILALQREEARLEGDKGQLIAQIARTHGQIAESELQLTQLDQNRLSEVVEEMRNIQTRIVELEERRITAQDQLQRVDIRSPRAGYVHQLSVHTVGGVITSGEVFATIVPEEDKLMVEARLEPSSIDEIQIGQNTTLRFSAFNQRNTPEIDGSVQTISADLTHDQGSGQSFYKMRIRINENDFVKLGSKVLVPGMPVEAFIQTSDRTVISYLLKPLSDQIMRSFREE